MARREEASGPIVVIGGHMTWPLNYWRVTKILAEISSSAVHVVPLTPLDWLSGHARGYGQLVFEVASTVDRALLSSGSDKAVLVAHSAGGILARVYLGGDPPYGGRRYTGYRRVSHLITLGTPHNVPKKGRLAPIAEMNELFPGVLHEPRGLRYLCVAGAAADGTISKKARKHYERFVEDGRIKGDGMVPVDTALLPGATPLVLDDLYHGRRQSFMKGRWYGSDRETVERWWPEELRVKGSLVEEPQA
jgi:pimeloyl-ACP methyl ester carboxylesterase